MYLIYITPKIVMFGVVLPDIQTLIKLSLKCFITVKLVHICQIRYRTVPNESATFLPMMPDNRHEA